MINRWGTSEYLVSRSSPTWWPTASTPAALESALATTWWVATGTTPSGRATGGAGTAPASATTGLTATAATASVVVAHDELASTCR